MARIAWLDNEVQSVLATEYSQYYDKERMQAVLNDSQRQYTTMRAGLVSDFVALAEKYCEYFAR
jgi:hypothetical protein